MRPSSFGTKDFDEYVHRLLVDWKVPGIAAAVVDGDDTVIQVCLPSL
jgi:hypothetical protein